MNLILVFAKAPVPGRVKTRLCPPLTPAQAAFLYRAFAADTAACCRGVKRSRTWLAYEPHPDFPTPAWLDPRAPHFLQEGRGLGPRLAAGFARAFAAGARKVLAVGADTPQLAPGELAAAFARLDRSDLVLGPAADGGYYLIGLKAPAPGLFRGVDWSTPRVLEQTRRKAAALALSAALLPRRRDVDAWDDWLALLRARGPRRAPASRRAWRVLTKTGLAPKLPR